MVAVNVDRMLNKELENPLMEKIFWIVSTTLLKHIKNNALHFKTFVANRVSYIREATMPSQWKYVSTSQNPAAQASSGLSLRISSKERAGFRIPIT